MDNKKYIECGMIINTHGIKGDIKIEHRCDDISVFLNLKKVYCEMNGGMRELRIIKSVRFKQFVLAHIEEIDDIDSALILKNRLIYALRDDIPLEEGSYFIADLIGIDVFDADSGIRYGSVSDYIEGAATGLYLVKCDDGREVYIPDVKEFVISVDPEKGLFLRPIGGMFDEV